MYYCDKNCQKADWKFHKDECKIYKNHQFGDDLQKLLLRLYLTLERFPEKRTQAFNVPGTDPQQFICFDDLQTVPEPDKNMLAFFEDTVALFRQFGLDFDAEKLFEDYSKMEKNSIALTNIYNFDIGVAIYVLECGFEHDCDPNACSIYKGTKREIRAIKKISSGKNVTINYLGNLKSREDRRRILKNRFYFTCSCRRCVNDVDRGKFFKFFNLFF